MNLFGKKLTRDIYRYNGTTSYGAYFHTLITHPGARFMFVYRMCNRFSSRNPLGIFFRIWHHLLQGRNNVELPHVVPIGTGMYFGHFQNIIVNDKSTIGDNCNIMQGVTLGKESRGKRMGAPTIGDRVVIGPNSIVVGKINVGNDVLIAPLTFVNFDVPDGSVVLGNPAKIVSDSGSYGYIKNVLKDIY